MSDVSSSAKFLTIRQFSLASPLSEATIRRRIRDGSLPFVQPGGKRTKILIPADALVLSEQAKQEFLVHDARDGAQEAKRIPGRKPAWAKNNKSKSN